MLQLQTEHKNKQRKLALQQQQQQNQQQQQQHLLSEPRLNNPVHLSTSKQELVDDCEAPKVPERKSSRANLGSQPSVECQMAPQYNLVQPAKEHRFLQQPYTKRSFDPDHLPRPLLTPGQELYDDDDYDEEDDDDGCWAPTLPPSGPPRKGPPLPTRLIKRPDQPPPPPPPPPLLTSHHEEMEEQEQQLLRCLNNSKFNSSLRRRTTAPKNIWSPSTSSNEISGSCNEFEDNDSTSINMFPCANEVCVSSGDLQCHLVEELSSSNPQTQENTVVDQSLRHQREASGETVSLKSFSSTQANKNNRMLVEKAGTEETEGVQMENSAKPSDHSDSLNVKLGEVLSSVDEEERIIAKQNEQEHNSTVTAGSGEASATELAKAFGEKQLTSTQTTIRLASVDKQSSYSDSTSDVAVAETAPKAARLQGESSKAVEPNESPLSQPASPPATQAWPAGATGTASIDRRQIQSSTSKARSFSIGAPIMQSNCKRGSEAVSKQWIRQPRSVEEDEELRKYWTLPANSAAQQQQVSDERRMSGLGRVVKETTVTRSELNESFSRRVTTGDAAAAARDKRVMRQPPSLQRAADWLERPTADYRKETERADEERQNLTLEDINANQQHYVQVRRIPLEQQLPAYSSKQEMQQTTGRDEWFRQMYKQMHKQSPEKNFLQTINSQPDNTQIKIKLKAPKTDHRYSPSYFNEDDLERKNFKPGSISDYLPGQSSISRHEHNLVSQNSTLPLFALSLFLFIFPLQFMTPLSNPIHTLAY